ncbi:glycosyltransferase family 2 protein [Seonamhaeicola sp.]|uniref:glycosyltransferase family 2 protein n=1 Tax=Seonamhaeicola sp. TaxID=1912245 RepID=UPI0026179FB6|nr:glycosyltransferase family 2 protein [Seonamhaeicola sp.]
MNHIVSIITPTYNSEKFIKQTIESIISQSYKNWELIVVDDASFDSTVAIVEEFIVNHSNIKLLQNDKNEGAAISRNNGIEAAQGDYIAFLDADDLWKSDKLEKQIEFIKSNNADVCFCSYDLMSEEGTLLNETVTALTKLSYKKFLKCNYIGNLTGIYHAKSLGKIYAPDLRKRQDWLMWLEAVKRSNKPALGMEESLAIYRVRKHSISSNKLNLVKYNFLVYRKGLGFSLIKSIYCFTVFLFEYFFIKPKQTVTSKEK